MKGSWIICFFFCLFLGTAQPPGKFSLVYGGAGDDLAYKIKQTLDGNYIIVGSSSSAGNGFTDVYLLKIDSLGQKMWEKYIGGAGSEVGRSVELLQDSGFVITGFTNSFGHGGYDLYVFRTNKDGELLWQRAIGGNDWEFGYASAVTANEEIISVGSGFFNGNQDILMTKIDTTGNIIWEKHFGGAQEDVAKSIYSPDGTNFFLAGLSKSHGDLNGDIYLVKCDQNGDSLFTKTFGHAGVDYANDVITDPAGNIILAAAITYSNGKRDAAILKTAPNGNLIWEKNYGISPEDKETYCILNSSSPVLGEQVATFSSGEIQGNNKDVKTIYINSGGDYFGGWFSGTFGFLQDDEIFHMSGCRDKGYISCGYTRSFSQSASHTDILVIKRDSVLNFGLSIISVDELLPSKTSDINVYPNPIRSEQVVLHYSIADPGIEVQAAILYDAASGRIPAKLNSLDHSLDVGNLVPGIYFLQLITSQGTWGTKLLVE